MEAKENYTRCQYCVKGINIPIDKRTICQKHGLVPQNHVCNDFAFDPFKMHVRRVRVVDFSKYEKENYSIDEGGYYD